MAGSRVVLTVKRIDAAEPRGKPYKLPDEKGLFLLVSPNGSKGWRFRFTRAGRESMLAFGNYPDVSLKLAREKRDEARRLLAQGGDPAAAKRTEKAQQAETFEAIAREWLAAGCPGGKKKNGPVDPGTVTQLRRRLETYVFPHHGAAPIAEITVPELHGTLRRLLAKNLHETAHRVRSVCSRVFRYAVATGRAERDPAADLRDALPSVATKSFAAITDPVEIGKLLRAIAGYGGQPTVAAALKLLPYVFVRPGELRNAEWSEIDLEKAEWIIPAGRMKMDREHWVPLSRQAVAIFNEVHPLTGHGRLVFPSIRSADRPISENTLNGALRRLDYTSDEMTSHGFRSMASTCLNELGFDPDVIEAQLAHVDKNAVRRIYNRAEYIEKRRGMMQAWADYLDGLRTGAKVTAIGRVG